MAGRIHESRFRQLIREGRISDAHQIARYAALRRRAILVASVIDLEAGLTDAALDMADKLIGGLFARARKGRERRYVARTRNIGRLMRLFHDTIVALAAAQSSERDAFAVVDETIGWARLLVAQAEVRELADLAGEDLLQGAADRYRTLRKFVPDLLDALEFTAARPHDPILAAIRLLRDLNHAGKRDIPADAPMPFRKEWKRLISEPGRPNRRLYETAVFATLRDKLRAGDVWVGGSSNYRRFDSYLLPPAAVPAIAAALGLPATADEWLARRGEELDRRLKRFARRLRRGQLEGVALHDGRLHVAPVKATTPPEAEALAAAIDAMLPPVRITELLHEVSRRTGFSAAFTNLRTGETCDSENALLAAILADATNLGLTRMAAASPGVTRDQLIWIADAYIRPETYQAALARIINAHHALPIAAIWGDGTTSSSDGQFFRSAKRGAAAGDINARYGRDPGLSFYTHLSDQHGPYSIKVMSATSHEAPYVLDGLLHHGTLLKIDTHYTDTGGASDHVFILCALLGIRFCPRLRDLPERKLACITPASTHPDLQPLLGQRIKTDLIREHWSETIRLVASLKAGIVAPSAMLRKLAAYRRQKLPRAASYLCEPPCDARRAVGGDHQTIGACRYPHGRETLRSFGAQLCRRDGARGIRHAGDRRALEPCCPSAACGKLTLAADRLITERLGPHSAFAATTLRGASGGAVKHVQWQTAMVSVYGAAEFLCRGTDVPARCRRLLCRPRKSGSAVQTPESPVHRA